MLKDLEAEEHHTEAVKAHAVAIHKAHDASTDRTLDDVLPTNGAAQVEGLALAQHKQAKKAEPHQKEADKRSATVQVPVSLAEHKEAKKAGKKHHKAKAAHKKP
jgi:hypothetical protein